MIGLLCFVLAILSSPFKSRLRLEAENAALRHQLMVLRRRLQGRVQFTNHDRWFFIQLYRWFPLILSVLTIVQPATLGRWHRAGFRCYWRWKSRSSGGRPQIDTELRVLSARKCLDAVKEASPSNNPEATNSELPARSAVQGRGTSNGCTFAPPAMTGFDGSKCSRSSRFRTIERASRNASFRLTACRSATLKNASPK